MTDSRKALPEKKQGDLSRQKVKNLNTQPTVIAHMQAGYLDSKSLASVYATCRGTHTLFREPVIKRKLLQHVVRGEQVQAEDIIRNQPELLFIADRVTDYSGRTFTHVTPITAAYGADDVDMLKMMFKYLDKSSKDKAIHHINEKFPEEIESKSYDFSPLVVAIAADENVEATLAQFRNNFAPRTIEKGKHFNMKILLAAYQVYNDNRGQWSDEQCSLFFRQVIGYFQRLLPACYAQAYCQGLYSVTDGGKPLQRDLKLKNEKFFYPSKNSHSGLGFEFGVYSFSYGLETHFARGGGVGHWYHLVEKLCDAKTSALRDLMQRPEQEQPCTIL